MNLQLNTCPRHLNSPLPQNLDSATFYHAMLYPLDYLMDMPASSMSRKRKFVAECAPRTLFFILLYVFLFITILAGERKPKVLKPRTPGLATSQKRLPISLSISAYSKWHKQQRKCLLDPFCEHPPVLIWQCPENNASKCAGIDERIHGIQFSLLLSIATNRLLFIDWPASPHRLDDALIPATFDWTIPTSVNPNPPVLNWFSGIERPREIDRGSTPLIRHLPAPHDREPDLNLEADDVRARLEKYPVLRIWTRLPPQLIQNIKSNANFAKSLSIYKNISILDVERMLLASLFKPSRDLTRVMNSVKMDIQRDYYSILYKTGTETSEDQNVPLSNGMGTMNDMVNEILKCLKQEQNLGHVFVTSDSMKFKSLLKEKAKGENVTVFISKHPIPELEAQNHQVTSQEEKHLSFLYYFADLFLLGGGKRIITTESNFANTAFLFGTASKLINMKGLKCSS